MGLADTVAETALGVKYKPMGRKSSAKNVSTPPGRQAAAKKSSLPMIAGVVALALVAAGVVYVRNRQSAPSSDAAQSAQPAPVAANLKPHPQANLPPLQFPGYQMPRSADVVTAAYKFAAEHPEVLSYVPCYCGCERQGHRGNTDCFVRSRDINGNVIDWDDHGMECTVCIDVATRSRQMFSSGASVRDIRAAIEKEYAASASTMTATPRPPQN